MNTDIQSIALALDPNNVPSFLLDWELTRLCNLDCTYCSDGHDNSTKHPDLNKCLDAIDFMYEYVNLYMEHKKPTQRKVILNVYGGESLLHPNILEILSQLHQRHAPYKNAWWLTVTCTTNALVGGNLWKKIVPLVDEFTVSYHSESLPKQKSQFKKNILYLKSIGKRFKTIVMMHNDDALWHDSENMIEFCKQNEIRYVTKPVDKLDSKWNYSADQFKKLKVFWMSQSNRQDLYTNVADNTETVNSVEHGRACCGGQLLSINNDLKSRVSYVPRQGFQDWYCSVNWFFLFIRQHTGEVFTNKDCRTSTTNKVEPLGNLSAADEIITVLKTQFETNTMPVIQCVKDYCKCGFCAPKASDKTDFQNLMKRHVINDVFRDINIGS